MSPAALPGDVARCPGYQADGEWRDGCEDCLRRTSPAAAPDRVWWMAPPVLVVLSVRRGLRLTQMQLQGHWNAEDSPQRASPNAC